MNHTSAGGLVHVLLLAAGLFVLISPRVRRLLPWNPMAVAAVLGALVASWTFAVTTYSTLFEDFTAAYYAAGVALQAGPQGLAPLLERGVHGFVNLPLVGYLFWPFGLMPERTASVVYALLGVAAVVWTWKKLVDLASLDQRRAAVLLLVIASNGPLIYGLKEGNTSHFVLLAVVLAMASLIERRDFRAGVLLGFAALVKPPLVLFGAYVLLRRRWGAVMGGAATLLLASGLSLAVFGWEMHQTWYRLCIEPFTQGVVPAFNVQSIQAFLLRWQLGIQGPFQWNPVPLVAPYDWIAKLLAGALFVVAAAVMVRNATPVAAGARERQQLWMEMSIVVALCSTTSPMSWSHYYTWFLLPLALFVSVDGSGIWRGRLFRAGGWIGLLLLSTPVIGVGWATGWSIRPYMAVATSGLLVGGLLWMMLLAIWRMEAPRSSIDIDDSHGTWRGTA